MAHKALWSGRFSEPLAASALEFSTSIDVDQHMYKEDIAGSMAHVDVLRAAKVLTATEARRIRTALKQIEKEIDTGKLDLIAGGYEDIHMAIEDRLIRKIGNLGGKLHTGRSRNDQVVLDERLFLRSAIRDLGKLVTNLQRVLLYKVDKYFGTVMPGYTHVQRAQTVMLSHHMLAYISMLDRDYDRLMDCRKRANKSPLGAAAFAGTTFPIDRMRAAKKLNFDGIVENSIDAVSDRDYLVEFVSACSLTMMHLSRLAEELVLWSSREFGYATISDAYTTGSSIMPQKKNPDMAELVRGKTGRVYGSLMNLLTQLKGLPLAYNRDLQEDKVPFFDAFQTTRASLFTMAQMLAHTTFHSDRMAEEIRTDYLTATDMADYLVRKGLPFRDAHAVTGKVVAHCVHHKMYFGNLDLDTLRTFSTVFEADIFDFIIPQKSVEQKMSAGSTSPTEVKKQFNHWSRVLKGRKLPKA